MAATLTQHNPPPEEEKKLRSEYNTYYNHVKDQQHELASADGELIKDLLNRGDALLQRVHKPREQATDAQAFALVTEGGVNYVKKLARGGKAYSAADFIRRLKAHYVQDEDAQEAGAADPRAMDWAAVGSRLSAWFRTAPRCHHMLGPMDAAPKAKRVMAQRRAREVIAEAVQPEQTRDLNAEDQQQTDRNMEEMWRMLKAKGGCAPLLELVLNHASFSQTVENLFTLSFLVKDNRVELRDNTVRGVEVVQVRQQAGGGERAVEEERVQFVISLDMAQWEQWKAVVREGDTLIAHRDSPGERVQLQRVEEEEEEEEEEAGPSTKRTRGR